MTSLLPQTVLGLLAIVVAPSGCSPAPPGGHGDVADSSATMTTTAETATLREVAPPAGPGALAPNLFSSSGRTLLTWLEPEEPERGRESPVRFVFAELSADGRWSEPQQIARGEGFFANWADLPGIVETGSGGSAEGESLLAHWLAKLGDGTYAYGVSTARSEDGGATWRETGLLHDDASPQEHGFVSYAAAPEDASRGAVQAFWLDGRAMGGGGTDEHDSEDGHGDQGGGAMQLRTVGLDADALDGESPPVSTLLDDRVCECCSTDAAWAAAGPLVVYRDRVFSPDSESGDEVRDISVVRWTDDGWSEPVTVHQDGWRITGCPVNGPAVAADGETVAVAWFTAPLVDGLDRPRVAVALSRDGGASFGEPTVLADPAENHLASLGRPLGRVDVALVTGEGGESVAWVSWLAARGRDGEVLLQAVSIDGPGTSQTTGNPRAMGSPRRVARTSQRRSAGFPRLAVHGEELLVTWVEDGDPARLRASLVPTKP